MKKLILLLVCIVLAVSLMSCRTEVENNENLNKEVLLDTDEEINDFEREANDESSTVVYNTAVELSEKFMSVCKEGNISAMYKLYYNDMLTNLYEMVKEHMTKEEFDSSIISEMKSITDYELFEYGSQEMPATVSPLYYVNYHYYRTTRKDTDLTESMVSSCANLRVYMDNNYAEHMLAKINGAWYVVA